MIMVQCSGSCGLKKSKRKENILILPLSILILKINKVIEE